MSIYYTTRQIGYYFVNQNGAAAGFTVFGNLTMQK